MYYLGVKYDPNYEYGESVFKKHIQLKVPISQKPIHRRDVEQTEAAQREEERVLSLSYIFSHLSVVSARSVLCGEWVFLICFLQHPLG